VTTLDIPNGAPAPARVGQATAVEQSRAVAEVFAQVQLARQYPRDEQKAYARMRQTCSSPRLAEKAFYEFPRGGEVVSGMTIHVAVALARCWGNLLHGLAEMARDDAYGQSEMQAFCWDLETNERHSHTFIVPHKRSTRRGSYKLEDPRDIYEANTNNGNRRWREAIFKALPIEFVEDAEYALRETLRKMSTSDGKTLPEKIEGAVSWYATDFNVCVDQLEQMLKKPRARWSDDDVIRLRSLGKSLKRGDLSVEDAFPNATVTPEELAKPAAAPATRSESEPQPAGDEAPQHNGHPEGQVTLGCPACVAQAFPQSDAA
jgi:hypothetical protein